MSEQERISALTNQIKDSVGMSASADGTLRVNASSSPNAETSDKTLVMPIISRHFDTHGKHVRGFNEANLGLGVKAKFNDDVSAMVVAYNNSYYDPTLLAGINYTPLKTNAGNFKAEAGVTTGVAYTEQGSYAKLAPKISLGHLTPVAGIITSIEHIPTGFGVDVNFAPPIEQNVGFVSMSITKRFK